MTRKPIRYRNAVTEMWNNGASMAEMEVALGLSEKRIKELLASARRGYNTPAEELLAEERAAAVKEAKKRNRR